MKTVVKMYELCDCQACGKERYRRRKREPVSAEITLILNSMFPAAETSPNAR